MRVTTETNHTVLTGIYLMIARVSWVVVFLLSLGLLLMGTAIKFQEPLPTNCAQVACNPIYLTGTDIALLQALELPAGLFTLLLPLMALLFNLSFAIVALLLFWLKSDDWLALLLSATLAALGGVGFSPAGDVLPRTYPALAPLITWLSIAGYLAASLLLLIFPDGRFAPRWTGWFMLFLMGSFSLVFLSEVTVLIGYLGFLTAAILTQIYRYRRLYSPLQRQQAKWGLLGLICVTGIMFSWSAVNVFFPAEQPTVARTLALLILWPVLIALGFIMPASFAVAILRYRLWDIDVIIRRTLIYGLLTALLALVYFGSVVLLQGLFRGLTGEDSDLVIAASTLVIAILFNPLRYRVQALIDRRFYRRKYDAAQVLSRFAQTARDEVDLDNLTTAMLGVVEETMQPAQVSLWLRKPEPAASQKP